MDNCNIALDRSRLARRTEIPNIMIGKMWKGREGKKMRRQPPKTFLSSRVSCVTLFILKAVSQYKYLKYIYFNFKQIALNYLRKSRLHFFPVLLLR